MPEQHITTYSLINQMGLQNYGLIISTMGVIEQERFYYRAANIKDKPRFTFGE